MHSHANVVERIYAYATATPASPAIVTRDGSITYLQLHGMTQAAALHLLRHGVKSGDVVGVSVAQNPLHIITLLALAHIGAVSLPLHIAVSAERRRLAASRFGASCVVSGREEMALPGLAFISLANLAWNHTDVACVEVHLASGDFPLRIAISSGTSGDPKGMVLTHGAVGLRMSQPDPEFSSLARTLPMDLNFIVGFRPMLSTLAAGATVVLPGSMESQGLLRALVDHAVTHTYLSPSQAQSLCDAIQVRGVHCPNLVCLRIGGGPMQRSLLHALHEKISPNVYVSYGSTESGLLTYATPEILSRSPHSVGRVCNWAEVEIVDEFDEPRAANTVGIVRTRSSHQVTGYCGGKAQDELYFRAGWFYPGDLGRFDQEGLLFIEGRSDEQLIIGGQKVNPLDIEAVVAVQEGVLDACAFAYVDVHGEALALALVLRKGTVLCQLQSQVREHLGPLAPQRYFEAESLPRTLTGKLRRAELTALYSPPVHLLH